MILLVDLLLTWRVALSMLLSAFAIWNYDRINKEKENRCYQCEITKNQRDEFRNMGDRSPLFRYTL